MPHGQTAPLALSSGSFDCRSSDWPQKELSSRASSTEWLSTWDIESHRSGGAAASGTDPQAEAEYKLSCQIPREDTNQRQQQQICNVKSLVGIPNANLMLPDCPHESYRLLSTLEQSTYLLFHSRQNTGRELVPFTVRPRRWSGGGEALGLHQELTDSGIPSSLWGREPERALQLYNRLDVTCDAAEIRPCTTSVPQPATLPHLISARETDETPHFLLNESTAAAAAGSTETNAKRQGNEFYNIYHKKRKRFECESPHFSAVYNGQSNDVQSFDTSWPEAPQNGNCVRSRPYGDPKLRPYASDATTVLNGEMYNSPAPSSNEPTTTKPYNHRDQLNTGGTGTTATSPNSSSSPEMTNRRSPADVKFVKSGADQTESSMVSENGFSSPLVNRDYASITTFSSDHFNNYGQQQQQQQASEQFEESFQSGNCILKSESTEQPPLFETYGYDTATYATPASSNGYYSRNAEQQLFSTRSIHHRQSPSIIGRQSPLLTQSPPAAQTTNLDALSLEYRKLLRNIPRKSREAFSSSDLAAFRTCHPHWSRNCYILMQNGFDIRLGEVGRAALKKEISRRLKGDAQLRERCVTTVCRLKNANVLQLLQMAEISGCLMLGLKISSSYWKEYSKKQQRPAANCRRNSQASYHSDDKSAEVYSQSYDSDISPQLGFRQQYQQQIAPPPPPPPSLGDSYSVNDDPSPELLAQNFGPKQEGTWESPATSMLLTPQGTTTPNDGFHHRTEENEVGLVSRRKLECSSINRNNERRRGRPRKQRTDNSDKPIETAAALLQQYSDYKRQAPDDDVARFLSSSLLCSLAGDLPSGHESSQPTYGETLPYTTSEQLTYEDSSNNTGSEGRLPQSGSFPLDQATHDEWRNDNIRQHFASNNRDDESSHDASLLSVDSLMYDAANISTRADRGGLSNAQLCETQLSGSLGNLCINDWNATNIGAYSLPAIAGRNH